MNKKEIENFKETVWNFYKDQGRHEMIWRHTTNPYYILVSEIMLQQTQVNRVTEKYIEFTETFPTTKDLAKAPLAKVLEVWQGLGYNRRAKYLKKAAEYIESKLQGKFPNTIDELIKLPGIGHATAGAIMTYAFNKPVAYIETNIRTIYIHHFFKNKKNISDKDVEKIVEQTLDKKNPRQWYWALMDYGTFLKKEIGNISQKSKMYQKQSRFKGSTREKRGKIIKYLIKKKKATIQEITREINEQEHEIEPIIQKLVKDEMVKEKKKVYSLAH